MVSLLASLRLYFYLLLTVYLLRPFLFRFLSCIAGNWLCFYSSCLDLSMFLFLFFLTSVVHHSVIFSFPFIPSSSICLPCCLILFCTSSSRLFFVLSLVSFFLTPSLFFPSPLAASHFQDVAVSSLISNESPSIKPDSTIFLI